MAIVTINGLPVVVIDAGMALWLEGNADLESLQVMTRELNPRVHAQLSEIRQVAAAVSGLGQASRRVQAATVSESRRSVVSPPDVWPLSSWLMSARDAADLLRVSTRQVGRYAGRGEIEGELIDGRWVMSRASVERHPKYVNRERGGRS